jgi:phage N-6-adenine-methyltransferase
MGKMNEGMFTSDSGEWETPSVFYDQLDEIFDFTLDVCASEHNKKEDNYFSKETDGLSQSWGAHRCFMNPPYGNDIKLWVEKARKEGAKEALVVCLLPARTDTKWFHDNIPDALAVKFIKGRLKFKNGGETESSAPFPSMVVVFGKKYLYNLRRVYDYVAFATKLEACCG